MKAAAFFIAAMLTVAGCGGSETTAPVPKPMNEVVTTADVAPEPSSGSTWEEEELEARSEAFSICASIPVFKQARQLGVSVKKKNLIQSELVTVVLPDIARAYADAHDDDHWEARYDGCLEGLALAPRG